MQQLDRETVNKEFASARDMLIEELKNTCPKTLPAQHIPNLIHDLVQIIGNLASSKAIFKMDERMQEIREKHGLKVIPGMNFYMKVGPEGEQIRDPPYQ